MDLKSKWIGVIGILAIFALVFMSVLGKESAQGVAISGQQVVVDDAPYFIKGICYHPVPIGSNERDFRMLDIDLELMVEAGINTIRVYEPIDDETVLDAIADAGIKVILGFGYNQGGQFDILSGTYLDYIKTYKHHESILFWELGNEYNYHPEWFGGAIENWYKAMNEAAQAIHKIDPAHPVSTAHGELPDELARTMCPDIDVWGMNVYRWDKPGPIYKQWQAVSNKPMYLSEAGADSYMTIAKEGYKKGSNEKAQADATEKILDAVFDNADIGSGVTLFAFVDELWKAGNVNQQDPGGWAPNSSGVPYDGTPNEEYWGILDIDRNKKMAFQVVANKYTKTN